MKTSSPVPVPKFSSSSSSLQFQFCQKFQSESSLAKIEKSCPVSAKVPVQSQLKPPGASGVEVPGAGVTILPVFDHSRFDSEILSIRFSIRGEKPFRISISIFQTLSIRLCFFTNPTHGKAPGDTGPGVPQVGRGRTYAYPVKFGKSLKKSEPPQNN